MNTEEQLRPSWFSGAWAEATGYWRKDHSLAESILGLSHMIADGQIEEATRVYKTELLPQLIRRRSGDFRDAETDSTQVKAMIESGQFPSDLCDELEAFFS